MSCLQKANFDNYFFLFIFFEFHCFVMLALDMMGDKGAGQLLIMVSYDLLKELQMRPFFMSMRGVISNYQPCHNVTNNLF